MISSLKSLLAKIIIAAWWLIPVIPFWAFFLVQLQFRFDCTPEACSLSGGYEAWSKVALAAALGLAVAWGGLAYRLIRAGALENKQTE